jgi:hypothetical protein
MIGIIFSCEPPLSEIKIKLFKPTGLMRMNDLFDNCKIP